ncbi:MAG TPA: hypothetical protein VHC94_11020 [Nitrobacter sp.]|jgi:hypothetical protein|nr:hypothetical protein [Nitrobacter sp.]
MAKEPKTRQCFVIGPIGDAGTPIRTDADDFMKYIVGPVVTKPQFGYQPIRADHLNEPGRITSQIIKMLLEADLVIADLSTNNANVYYELSLRHALGKPVIHMAVEGTKLSFDVRDNRTIFYTMHSRSAEEARNELERQIQHVLKDGYRAKNPILETIGIVQLERSEAPEDRAFGHIMAKLSQMDDAVREIQQTLEFDRTQRNLAKHQKLSSLFDLGAGLPKTAEQQAVGLGGLLSSLGTSPNTPTLDAFQKFLDEEKAHKA